MFYNYGRRYLRFMLEKTLKSMSIYERTARLCRLLEKEEAVSGEYARAEILKKKLERKDMTVAVIGQFKRGKSALANRILDEAVMPVGIVPITSAVTKVKAGEKRTEVHYENGKVEEVAPEDLHFYISEQENNMKESDAVIFLLSVDSPINQIEIDFLKSTRDFAAKFYFAVNKIDSVSREELSVYLEYCKTVLGQITGETAEMFPVSAKTGEGVEELKDAIIKDLRLKPQEIMEESTAMKLVDLIDDAIEQLNFYWKAMNMEYGELDVRFEEIEKTLDSIKKRAEDCAGGYNLFLNEFKRELSAKVRELFGMEYHYDIDLLKIGLTELGREEFLLRTEELCDDLAKTLNRILLYREENAYTVCRRINAINRLTREIRRIRDSLRKEGR